MLCLWPSWYAPIFRPQYRTVKTSILSNKQVKLIQDLLKLNHFIIIEYNVLVEVILLWFFFFFFYIHELIKKKTSPTNYSILGTRLSWSVFYRFFGLNFLHKHSKIVGGTTSIWAWNIFLIFSFSIHSIFAAVVLLCRQTRRKPDGPIASFLLLVCASH